MDATSPGAGFDAPGQGIQSVAMTETQELCSGTRPWPLGRETAKPPRHTDGQVRTIMKYCLLSSLKRLGLPRPTFNIGVQISVGETTARGHMTESQTIYATSQKTLGLFSWNSC